MIDIKETITFGRSSSGREVMTKKPAIRIYIRSMMILR